MMLSTSDSRETGLSSLGGTAAQHGRPPLVLVPGLCGSRLLQNELLAWPCTVDPRASLQSLEWPNEDLVADSVVWEWDIAGLLRFTTGYGLLREGLSQQYGYELGRDLIEFAYDWRQDCRQSAEELRKMVRQWKRNSADDKVVVLAHSMGGLVARYWIEQLGGADDVQALVLIASPAAGTPLAFEWLVQGGAIIPIRALRRRLALLAQTLPSAYQLLPLEPFVRTTEGDFLDIYTDRGWLPTCHHDLLDDAIAFHAELGLSSSVPTVALAGRGFATPSDVIVDFDQPEPWLNATVERDGDGDGLVPARSAMLIGDERFLVASGHEKILADEALFAVLDRMIRPGSADHGGSRNNESRWQAAA